MGRRVKTDSTPASKSVPGLMPRVRLGKAIGLVQDSWLNEGLLSGQSVERMGETLLRFASRAESEQITFLHQVKTAHVRSFVHAVLPDGTRPENATMHARRTSVRAFYRTARFLKLTDLDPTMDVLLPGRQIKTTRPVSDEELLLLRTASVLKGDGRASVVLALAEATAVTSEITSVRIKDLDNVDKPRVVALAGTARHRPRDGVLTVWGSKVLSRRVKMLQAKGCTDETLLAYGGLAPAGSGRAQASVCNALGELLESAGFEQREGIRPGSVRAWSGRKIFESSGLTSAAVGLGLSSLDQTALVINYQWQLARNRSQ